MLIIAGTVPDNEFPLTSGTLSRFGDDLVIEGRRFSCTQGTGAMASAALAVTSYLGMDSPLAVLAGDTGQGQGSRELYEYLIENVPELQPDVLALHYWLPDREQTRRLCDAVKKMKKKPVLIADAASMYSAKLAGLAPFFDIFTPDAAETAFLADADAPHPAYVKFMMYNNMDRTEEVIHIAYRLGNASQLMLVKGKTDYIVVNDNIVATVNEPDIPAMEAIGGTGDTITGMVAAFCSAGLKPREAALLAARANRAAGLAARVTPATRVKEIITALPGIFQENLCSWTGACITGGRE